MAKKEEEPQSLSAPYAYLQAARMLKVAEKYALERKDSALMTGVANSWVEIGYHLLTTEMELVYASEDDEEVEEEETFTVGFTVPKESGENDGEEETEPTAGTTED